MCSDPSPTAWIEADPMELAGVLNISVEGTDGHGHSTKDQLEIWHKNSSNVAALHYGISSYLDLCKFYFTERSLLAD